MPKRINFATALGLQFVRRGVSYCGAATREIVLLPPFLGVSSLDLGR
jgi:hypothetical protein